jgi:RimJ/RimL family protein N-acetyltransferase
MYIQHDENVGWIRNILYIRGDVSTEPLAMKHASDMFRWMLDPSVSRNLGLRSEPSLENTIAWLDHYVNDPSMRAFAVLYGGQHVGNVIFDRIDSYIQSARLSVYIGELSARKAGGVGTAGIYLALLEAFSNLELNKVWLTVHVHNYPALNVYRKFGFQLEGILRDEFWIDGQRSDVIYMGLLKWEFTHLNVIRKPENHCGDRIDHE